MSQRNVVAQLNRSLVDSLVDNVRLARLSKDPKARVQFVAEETLRLYRESVQAEADAEWSAHLERQDDHE